MIRCNKCQKRIKKKHLDNVFKLTLGNIKNGLFYGNKNYYYHIEELSPKTSLKIS